MIGCSFDSGCYETVAVLSAGGLKRVDLDARHLAFAIQHHHHHAAAGAALAGRPLHLGLHLRHAALQLLRLLHHLREVFHLLVLVGPVVLVFFFHLGFLGLARLSGGLRCGSDRGDARPVTSTFRDPAPSLQRAG